MEKLYEKNSKILSHKKMDLKTEVKPKNSKIFPISPFS